MPGRSYRGRRAPATRGGPGAERVIPWPEPGAEWAAAGLRRFLLAVLWLIPVAMLTLSTLLICIQILGPKIPGVNSLTWYYYYSNLHAAYHMLTFARGDSWYPMLIAREFINSHPGQDVYQSIFFTDGVKFQYPATSLLFIEWLDPDRPNAVRILNSINLIFFVATAVGLALLTLSLAKRHQTGALQNNPTNRRLLAAVATMATLCFYPLLRAGAEGQIQVVLDAFFVWACCAFLMRRFGTSGVLIGLSTLIKPQMAMFLIWGLLRRDWRFVTGWAVPVMSGLFVSLFLYGAYWPLGYLKVLSFIGAHGESFFANQSVNGLVHRMLRSGTNLVWQPSAFAPYNPVVYVATIGSSALLVLAGLTFGLRSALLAQSVTSMMLAGICFTMASPVVWEHHYGVMLPAFAMIFVAFLCGRQGTRLRGRAGWIVLGIAFLVTSNSLAPLNMSAGTTFNFVQSYVLFGALATLALLAILPPLPAPGGGAPG